MIKISVQSGNIAYNDSAITYNDPKVTYIGGTLISEFVDWHSFEKVEGLTKEPDTLSFQMKEIDPTVIPNLGDEVNVQKDGETIFGGIIVETSAVIIGGILIGHKIDCKDFMHTFDRQLVIKSYENQTVRDIILDIVANFTTGFTTNNVPTDTPTVSSIRFNYEAPTKAIQKLVDLVNWDWYIDYEKDVNLLSVGEDTAPFEVNDTNGKINWPSLEINRNILDLRNSVIIRGGEFDSAISEANAVDNYEADGVRRSFNLALKYSNISVKLNGAAQTVGIDNITDPTTVDVLYNFTEKTLKWPETSKPSAGDDIVVFGDAKIPLIAKVRDQISINTYGEYQDVKIDKTIISVNQAESVGKSTLIDWADGLYEVRFTTNTDGLRTGQVIRINSVLRGIDKSLKINRIVVRTRSNDSFEYDVFCIASGETTFIDIMVGLLGQDKINVDINSDEVLQRLETFLEQLDIVESVTPIKQIPPYTWGPGGSNDFEWNFATWS